MELTVSMIGPIIKRVAKNVAALEKRKDTIKNIIAKYQQEYDFIDVQQDLFEQPVRNITGGYSTSDLVVFDKTGSGKDSIARVNLRWPDTVLPPAETDPAGTPCEPAGQDTADMPQMSDGFPEDTDTPTGEVPVMCGADLHEPEYMAADYARF